MSSNKNNIPSKIPLNYDSDENDDFELSEMLATQQSREEIAPSEFGYTPKSQFGDKSNFNPDASFDYSIIGIEYMADNHNNSKEDMTPKRSPL